MRKSIAGGIALVVLVGAWGAGASSADSRMPHKPHAFSKNSQFSVEYAKILEQLRRNDSARIYGAGEEPSVVPACQDQDDKTACTIQVEITETYSAPSGGVPRGCLIKVNDVSVDTQKIHYIHWVLTSAASAASSSTTYSFYPGKEILVVDGTEAQIDKKMAAYPNGAVANPVVCSTVASAACSVRTKYQGNKHDDITYYPVVMQNLGESNKILCGALDPKIVNN